MKIRKINGARKIMKTTTTEKVRDRAERIHLSTRLEDGINLVAETLAGK